MNIDATDPLAVRSLDHYATMCLMRWANDSGRECVETLFSIVGIAQFAADEAYRENLRQARAEALSKATIERQKREAIEDRKREKELVKALGDGSRNWRPDASSRFGSKPDTHAFLPKEKRTTGGE